VKDAGIPPAQVPLEPRVQPEEQVVERAGLPEQATLAILALGVPADPACRSTRSRQGFDRRFTALALVLGQPGAPTSLAGTIDFW
jgi:hypothetical protein